ncbi:MAG: hypothetical protein R2800_12405 [Flavipsychrobacter sp.]
METTQALLFDLSEKNILEEFYELIEKHRTANSKFSLGNFYDILEEFDRQYQDFNVNSDPVSKEIVNKYLVQSLFPFLVMFKYTGFSDRPIFYAFKRFIHWFSFLLSKSDNIKSEFFYRKNIIENFPTLWGGQLSNYISKHTEKVNFNINTPSQYDELYYIILHEEDDISYELGTLKNKRKKPIEEWYIFSKEFTKTKIKWDEKRYRFVEIEETYEMYLDFEISVKDNRADVLSVILFKIISSLASVHNVKIEFEKISVGSLIGRVRIYLKDLLAKEETKAILETTKESLVSATTFGKVSYSNIKKQTAETEKIRKERDLLDKEIRSLPNETESKIINAINLEKKVLENEKLRNEIIDQKIEQIYKLSNLVESGILEADDIKININEIQYLLKQGDNLLPSEVDIDDIT